jgi:uroporphyrinogen-III synthase
MSVKRYLVTRPRPAGEAFAAELQARGFAALLSPLFEVRFRTGPDLDLAGIAAVLATSANGVSAFARRTPGRDVPLFAVGPETADVAREAGFRQVEIAGGNGADLAALAASRVSAGARLLHAAGSNGKPLAVPGCRVERCELYDLVAFGCLSDEATAALEAGTLAGAFFFSPKSAAGFRAVVEAGGLERFCAPLSAHCIGKAAAKALSPLAFAHIFIASAPNRAALLDTLPVS